MLVFFFFLICGSVRIILVRGLFFTTVGDFLDLKSYKLVDIYD